MNVALSCVGTEFFFFLKWRTVIPSTRETRSVVTYLFKTPLRHKDSLPSRTRALFLLRGVPDKKHYPVLSRKTRQTRIVVHMYAPRDTCYVPLCANESVCVVYAWHTRGT